MTLSANQYICPEGFNVETFLDTCVRLGYRSVGLTRAALAEMSVGDLTRAVRSHGLEITSLNSAGYFTWRDAGARRQQHDVNLHLLDAAVELEAGTLCVITGGMAEQPDIGTARALVAEGLAELDEQATARGVRLGLEPIHPVGTPTKGVVNSIAQASRLIEPLSATGVILDLSHSWWDPDLLGMMAVQPSPVRLVQICNVLNSEHALPRRSQSLDKGALKMPEVLSAIRAAGYAGPFEFEVFAVDHDLDDPAPLLESAMDWYRAFQQG